MNYTIFMRSDLYGEENFPRDTLEEALETIQRLILKCEGMQDGVEREIGLIINDKVFDCECGCATLRGDIPPFCPRCGAPIPNQT